MNRKSRLFSLFLLTVILLNSCQKTETITSLKDTFEPTIGESENLDQDFFISLKARALQKGEKGEWKILKGPVLDDFVYFEDKGNPFTKFKGLPGEEYELQWKRWDKNGVEVSVKSLIKIPQLNIEIIEGTAPNYETIRHFQVNPKYRGTWSFTPAYGYIVSNYFDGYAEPPEKKPSIELHGYANTDYTATYTYNYAGKEYKFQKTIKTGNYTQDEALSELQVSRGSTKVIEDNAGNIIELSLQASGSAWILNETNRYPALKSLKFLRKLILGGSALSQIPSIFGEAYTNLEELNMDRIGQNLIFPENFGNLTKLKTLIVSPLYSVDASRVVTLPKSFANLKSLESFKALSFGFLDFNGTLGGLTNLKELDVSIKVIPENIGQLKKLENVSCLVRDASIPNELSDCTGLKFLRLQFLFTPNVKITLPNDIEKLQKLEKLEMTTKMLYTLPESISKLKSLKVLTFNEASLQQIPKSFGELLNLEDLTLYGEITSLPTSFGNLNKLTYLHLGGNVEELPESFGNLSSLIYFNASSSGLKRLPESFGKLKKLKEFAAQGSKLESLPESFEGLEALEKLTLNYCQLTTFPKSIINLKKITTISLSGNLVGDIPDDISKMKTGVVLYLNQVSNLTPAKMKHILSLSKGKSFYTDFGYFHSPI